MSKINWTKIAGMKGEHRLFISDAFPGAVAIADNSGRTPDHTDDGRLFISAHREWEVYVSPHGNGIYFRVPLEHQNGDFSGWASLHPAVAYQAREHLKPRIVTMSDELGQLLRVLGYSRLVIDRELNAFEVQAP